MVERIAQGVAEPTTVLVRTTAPERRLVLTLTTDGGALAPAAADGDGDGDGDGTAARLSLPGEAFVRLAYGRLDPDHTPPTVTADGIDLDTLRATFPGV
jgi:MDMPI C-terminal domain